MLTWWLFVNVSLNPLVSIVMMGPCETSWSVLVCTQRSFVVS